MPDHRLDTSNQPHNPQSQNADASDLPPLAPESELSTSLKSPADPDSEDPILRSLKSGQLQLDDIDDDVDIDRVPDDNMPQALKDLHPYAQILALGDLGSCLKLEQAVFPSSQAASSEKIEYRLGSCGELCLGFFSSAEPNSPISQAATASTANAPDSSEPARKGILLAMIMATKTSNMLIRDEDMMIPSDRSKRSDDADSKTPLIGHDEAGRTIGIHSLAVLPNFQNMGLGTRLMKAYVQRMVEADVADRIAILTFERLVPYYEHLGFENKGESTVNYGGGQWINMVLDFEHVRPRSEEL